MTVGMTSHVRRKPPLAPRGGKGKPTALLPALGRGGAGGRGQYLFSAGRDIQTPPLPLPYKGGERLPDEYVLHLK